MELYRSTDPFLTALAIAATFAAICWLLSIVTREYSWVDRLWSIAPVIYAVHFAGHAGFADARLDLIAILIAVWGVRLTYNYARKGGYERGGEDYRWEEIQEQISPTWFQALNLTFIAPFQNLLLLFIVAPAYVAYQNLGTPLNTIDYSAAAVFLLLLSGETIADEQQWRFQSARRERKARGETPEAEFITTGLFRYSRHPNFFCEQAMWWTVYAFSIAAGAPWLNWSIVGAATLVGLFQGSTWLTERISARKYPAYRDYQLTTSRLIPWFPRRNPRHPPQ